MKIEKINELFARFAGQLLKMRWITLGIFALVIIVSVIGMKRMVKETSFDDYFIEDDPMLVMTDEFKSHFGNDYYVGVLTQCDDHFTKENLTTLRTLSNELLDSLSYADKVTSRGENIEIQVYQPSVSRRTCCTTRWRCRPSPTST